jgi:hypothetical protein
MPHPGIPEKAIKILSIRNKRDPKKNNKTRPSPERANVCLLVLSFALKRANISLRGARRPAYCSFRVLF